MARDIRELFKDDKIAHEKMPENHQDRFLKKLDESLPVTKRSTFLWMQIAASVVVLLGLSYGAFKFFQPQTGDLPTEVVATNTVETKTLGDISPGLKKVEDYYLASINLELSKMTYTTETKELFDDYLEQLDKLDKEYKRLLVDLTESGPSELTVNALIDNLKFRLNLLYRLRSQLKELNTSDEGVTQSI
ncbi:DUF3379 domain-containing protein [Flaviramulus sp. BrNp1-15]|uniref:DUF3379 domain-containing protein n=1 Tax=Flaviramulus sp. BrNp1-15 TaxID=2916754 RepID=UPI001EE9659F|nr:DUF3379 domain-containing protein [Flaviramulus sp. BrNp1-15]ULC58542.1 DUF3379 domain-containing protein [Flaviramulus sp. BrNp1-15]